jgi:hypothetical protein
MGRILTPLTPCFFVWSNQLMRVIPKDKDELITCLIRQPDDRAVEAEPDTAILATTVKALRELPSWPGSLVVTTPSERHPELVVKISKVTG